MKWAIEIQETSLERRNLSDLLNGLGFKLVEGIQYPAFTSPEVDACITATDAFEKAKGIRAAFKETAQIDPEFALGSVIDYSSNPPKCHAFIEVESCVHTMSMGTPTLSVSPPDGLWDRFRDAVHNASVHGDWARHATYKPLRNPNPMTKSDAETFVRDIAVRWLRTVR